MLPATTDRGLGMVAEAGNQGMGDKLDRPVDSRGSSTYRIRIAGQLDARWAAWLDDLTITLDEGDTLLTGPVVDQAALHGLLRRVPDLGLPLVSVARDETEPSTTLGAGQADVADVAHAGSESDVGVGVSTSTSTTHRELEHEHE